MTPLNSNYSEKLNETLIQVIFTNTHCLDLTLLFSTSINDSSNSIKYSITFRSFGAEAYRFGSFLTGNETITINYIQLNENIDCADGLYITCIYYIEPRFDPICKDLKFDDGRHSVSPSYNPLFVPLMYALSIFMLFPVIIQHHRKKTKLLLARQQQIRRLSLTITNVDPNENHELFTKQILSKITNRNYLNTATTSFSSLDKYISNSSDLIDHNEQEDDDDNNCPNANDSIEHLLSSKPWLTVNGEPISDQQTFYNPNNDLPQPFNLFKQNSFPSSRKRRSESSINKSDEQIYENNYTNRKEGDIRLPLCIDDNKQYLRPKSKVNLYLSSSPNLFESDV
ncbi:unnamed protein product [Didymodactylos carnosus]|uniref:Uncharacterized protein n=1 Tax=Didymodactylos carnosus TaxID=1234261 RepID=A0A814B0E6_9BILA|nr:unnamed protein product [Didymodactylos carnosus]CAF1290725.1 unnamed protein product [Didymodactylos carnosus]CAF3701677.1 unnamed protein product [Didymodactylos carnosus]CAF4095524.1 unnamed protein product [Didymodactylos carnosus]